jgi:predicted DNA-binding transcriptional regulator AlpA
MSKRQRESRKSAESKKLTKITAEERAANARAARTETIAAVRPDDQALQLPQLIDRKTLLEIVPLSYVTILELISKGEFPRPYDLFGKNCWYGSEVGEVLKKLPLRRIKSDRR